MKVNETELIEFFSVLPDEQPDEEKDFFGTTSFTVRRSHTVLYVSFCVHEPEVMIHLSEDGSDAPTYSALHRDVESVELRREPDGIQWLHILSKHNAVLIRPDPIQVKLKERC